MWTQDRTTTRTIRWHPALPPEPQLTKHVLFSDKWGQIELNWPNQNKSNWNELNRRVSQRHARPEDGVRWRRRQRRQAGEWDGWTEERMRGSKVRSETAGEMGGGMSFPLLNYCSVYLASTLNHCGPTQPEGYTYTNTCVYVYVCARHMHLHRDEDIVLLLFRTFHQVIFSHSLWLWGRKRIDIQHTHRDTHTNTHSCAWSSICLECVSVSSQRSREKLHSIHNQYLSLPLTHFWPLYTHNLYCQRRRDRVRGKIIII